MKLTLFLILAGLLQVSATVYSQNTRFSLNIRGKQVAEVLKEIEEESNFRFFYQREQVDVTRTVDLKVNGKTVEEILDLLFEGEGITYKVLEDNLVLLRPEKTQNQENSPAQQQKSINGKVTSTSGDPLPGVTVVVKGTTTGTITNANGGFVISNVPLEATLVFSFVGMKTQEVVVGGKTTINVTLADETVGIEEVVAVGYGTQKKSDITGTVSSISPGRLEMSPNLTIAQAIQGAVSGVMMSTSSAGAEPSSSILIRGRNSIKASNEPLIVVDGSPYGGQLSDLNPNDVKSIEVLKDASSAAIYGSRGSNGVILVSTKIGQSGKQRISYDGYYSMQKFTKLPDLMNGEEFYKFKLEREPKSLTQSETEVYNSGKWVDWLDLALRNGTSSQHNLSLSGGGEKIQYYIAGGFTNIRGLAVNDDFKRVTSRINLDVKVTDWLSLGSRTLLSSEDKSGISPTWDGDQGVFWLNPLTKAYDGNGQLTINPWPEDTYFGNPLMGTLAQNIDKSYQVNTNNFAIIDLPFVPGLNYRLNTSVRLKFRDVATYYGRDTYLGLLNRGDAYTNRAEDKNIVIENIVNYNKQIGKHNFSGTFLYSYEKSEFSENILSAKGFPNDFLTWYSASQANLIVPNYNYYSSNLLSQMIRINYSYNSRYLLTLTTRRDGFSGFGSNSKWGIFPSIAFGWNLANEDFFKWDIFNELKFRASWGINGNQAVGSYETITRLSESNIVESANSLPGYIPSKLGSENLGWESTNVINFGLDFGLFSNRIRGDINIYKSNTSDLLLNRSISSVHGITTITENIGKTENRGIEISVISRNITSGDFNWQTTGNLSIMKNEIVSLYGKLDENGNEIDDIVNLWFIGQPIRVNFDYVQNGVWQTTEKDQAALYKTQPGYVKISDLNGDGLITVDDRTIIGQLDPKLIWGLNNSFSYKNLTLSIFAHGVHGVTKNNTLLSDNVYPGVRRNTTIKNWWTPDNPTNDFYMNKDGAAIQGGVGANYYENGSYIRIKDIILSYDLPNSVLNKIHLDKLRIYITGRNLFTFTTWTGLDPELDNQRSTPYQKEYVIGLNLGF